MHGQLAHAQLVTDEGGVAYFAGIDGRGVPRWEWTAPGSDEVVVVASFPHAGFPGGRQEEFVLDIEPCKRYYLNAQFESNLSPRFEIVVDQVETIPGCAAAKG